MKTNFLLKSQSYHIFKILYLSPPSSPLQEFSLPKVLYFAFLDNRTWNEHVKWMLSMRIVLKIYQCMYICMFVMYVYGCMYVYVCMCVCGHACMHHILYTCWEKIFYYWFYVVNIQTCQMPFTVTIQCHSVCRVLLVFSVWLISISVNLMSQLCLIHFRMWLLLVATSVHGLVFSGIMNH